MLDCCLSISNHESGNGPKPYGPFIFQGNRKTFSDIFLEKYTAIHRSKYETEILPSYIVNIRELNDLTIPDYRQAKYELETTFGYEFSYQSQLPHCQTAISKFLEQFNCGELLSVPAYECIKSRKITDSHFIVWINGYPYLFNDLIKYYGVEAHDYMNNTIFKILGGIFNIDPNNKVFMIDISMVYPMNDNLFDEYLKIKAAEKEFIDLKIHNIHSPNIPKTWKSYPSLIIEMQTKLSEMMKKFQMISKLSTF
jgi:hypothetical protein